MSPPTPNTQVRRTRHFATCAAVNYSGDATWSNSEGRDVICATMFSKAISVAECDGTPQSGPVKQALLGEALSCAAHGCYGGRLVGAAFQNRRGGPGMLGVGRAPFSKRTVPRVLPSSGNGCVSLPAPNLRCGWRASALHTTARGSHPSPRSSSAPRRACNSAGHLQEKTKNTSSRYPDLHGPPAIKGAGEAREHRNELLLVAPCR